VAFPIILTTGLNKDTKSCLTQTRTRVLDNDNILGEIKRRDLQSYPWLLRGVLPARLVFCGV